MSPTTTAMARADYLYTSSRTLSLTRHPVSFPALRKFNAALNQFGKLLGESKGDPYWGSFINPLKRYRFDLCAAPWPVGALQDYTRKCQGDAMKHLQGAWQMYPSLAEPAKALVDDMEAIANSNLVPMLEGLQAIANEIATGEKTAIIIPEPRLVSTAREAIATSRDYAQWPVLAPRNLRGLDTYDCFVIIGSPSWYWRTRYVFSAPRASSIHILCYDWLSVRWRHEPVFTAPIKGSAQARQISIDYVPDSPEAFDEDIAPPVIDIDKVMQRAEKDSAGDSERGPTLARLLVLEDDTGVFIEAEGDSTVLIIDLSQDADRRVRRVIHRNVEPGLFILLRTAGGGDYVVPVADRLLGDRAEELRDMQLTWKARLRLAVKKSGMDGTILTLWDLGSKVASYQNLRNWMLDRTIATNDPVDFFAIMAMVGLHDEAKSYWEAMKTIRRAHAKAGRQIRRQLVGQVNKSDLAELNNLGSMEFVLGEEGGGSLTAFRINSVIDRVVEVRWNLIGVPFPLEDM